MSPPPWPSPLSADVRAVAADANEGVHEQWPLACGTRNATGQRTSLLTRYSPPQRQLTKYHPAQKNGESLKRV